MFWVLGGACLWDMGHWESDLEGLTFLFVWSVYSEAIGRQHLVPSLSGHDGIEWQFSEPVNQNKSTQVYCSSNEESDDYKWGYEFEDDRSGAFLKWGLLHET